MYIVTGALGFIGWNMVKRLVSMGYKVQASDCLGLVSRPSQVQRIHIMKAMGVEFIDYSNPQTLIAAPQHVDGVIHLGALSSSVNKDWNALLKLNIEATKRMFELCAAKDIPLVYASSASTYGQSGDCSDFDELLVERPGLSLYARSKWLTDRWTLEQAKTPPIWAGLKFFCVYGPGEEHKGPQASIFHKSAVAAFSGQPVTLFQTDKSPLRDFVHVDDVCNACLHFLSRPGARGQYNVGTGSAFPFEAVPALFDTVMGSVRGSPSEIVINRVPFPQEILEHYQYTTKAVSPRAEAAGYFARITPPFGAALMVADRLAQV